MSAKDTADAILRDFRTSMAETAIYLFDDEVSAEECLAEMEMLHGAYAELYDNRIVIRVFDGRTRKLTA